MGIFSSVFHMRGTKRVTLKSAVVTWALDSVSPSVFRQIQQLATQGSGAQAGPPLLLL
jgi:hypothetical protein